VTSPRRIEIYDTTLRDGAQTEGIAFSLEDKLRITEALSSLGIHFVEGGWPGANPKDAEYFKHVRRMKLGAVQIAAFGSTRRPNILAGKDENLIALLDARTPVITIVGKTWDMHVRDVLRAPLDENLRMIEDSVAFLTRRGAIVFFDAEHFFDGYAANPEYALSSLRAAVSGGAARLVLCDTNGGALPDAAKAAVTRVCSEVGASVGIHAHDDGGLAVAVSLAAVVAGASQVQGTMNGYGERCGNANLCAVLPNLMLKMRHSSIPANRLDRLTSVSRFISELANQPHRSEQPFVGRKAFAHKAGIHANAVGKNPKTYEHVDPAAVGNERRILVSDQAGRHNVVHLAARLGIDLKDQRAAVTAVLNELKELEFEGYQFEGAEGSFELLLRKHIGNYRSFFELESFRVDVNKRHGREIFSEATIKVRVASHEEFTVGEGDGPVNAIDNALRKALEKFYPQLCDMQLCDYKVRVLDERQGTGARVRVLITSKDKMSTWGTVGVSSNVIEASWKALVDSIEYKLMKDQHGK
jgi:2-isopropylmalate synthase